MEKMKSQKPSVMNIEVEAHSCPSGCFRHEMPQPDPPVS